MSTEKSKTDSNISSEIDWSPENEIKLFYALRGHKPVGVAKNFHMISILDEFSKLTEKEVSSKTIWKRLEKLYDMETLNENENPPFPTNSVPFNIEGIKEFDELLAKVKGGTDGNKSEKAIETKEETEVTPNSTKSGNKMKSQDLNKTNTKVKTENEKNSKSDRKEESVKQMDKSDETEDKSNRSKKQITKPTTELRSASHNASSSAKKRK